MPRPRIDVDAKRRELLDSAEQLIDQHGTNKVTMQDISAACGMSQSNIYRFFSSKEELLSSLADRWFQEIEAELERVMCGEQPPIELLERFIKTQFKMKRDRFDENPELFVKYLSLAMLNPDAVATHVKKLRVWLQQLVKRSHSGNDTPTHIVGLVEDMTIKFRDPHLISAHRKECTDRRLDAVLGAVREVLQQKR